MQEWTATEHELHDAFKAGEELDITGRAERTIRGEVFSELLREAGPDDPGYAPPLRLRGATIAGWINLDGANIVSRVLLHDCDIPDGASFVDARTKAMSFDECRITGLFLRSAVVRGRLSLREAQLDTYKGEEGYAGYALICDTVTVEESLRLDGARVNGLANMASVRIDRQLVITKAKLRNPGKTAFNAQSATIGSDLGGEEVVAEGKIHLDNCNVGGVLNLSGARLQHPEGSALSACGAEFSRAVQLTNSFFAHGTVALGWCIAKQGIDFSYSRCTGMLNLSYATISGGIFGESAFVEGRDGWAIILQGTSVAKDVCLESVVALGGINAEGLHTQRNFDLRNSRISVPSGMAFNAHGISIGRDFNLESAEIDGDLRLIEATTTQLTDNRANLPGKILINGFTYTTLFPHEDAKTRLQWVRRNKTNDPQIRTQPYEQLARNYRHLGDDRAARTVLCAKEHDITRHNTSLWRKPGRYFLEWLVGYGHLPGRASWWVVGAWLFGTAIFLLSPPEPTPGEAPHVFNPAFYSLDVLLPAPNLGLESHFQAVGITLLVTVLLKLTGWVLSIAIGASISRTLSRK
jgi:hypothetical protein